MPLYEYVCHADDERLELLRPMSEADAPVPDPKGLGRTFERTHSVFSSKGASPSSSGGGGGHVHSGGCCPCGKNRGGCGAG